MFDFDDVVEVLWIMFVSVFIFSIIIGGGICITTRIKAPGRLAQIEQVRNDITYLSENNAEDVIGQAVELNRLLACNKKYNNIWWSDIFIPDAYNNVDFIEIKKED